MLEKSTTRGKIVASLVSPKIESMVAYVPGKPSEELRRELGVEHIIKLASNENPFGPSPLARAALRAAAGEMHLYPDGSAHLLRNRLAQHLNLPLEQILLSNGSNEAIELIVRTFRYKGCDAVISQGSFIVYRLACISQDVDIKEIPLNGWSFDLDAMADAITEKTRFVFIANPNNPTGTYINRETLIRFLDRVPSDVLVSLDEAYFEFANQPDYPNGLTLLEQYPNLLVLRTFSKCYGLAGIRVGYTMARPELIAYLNRVRAPFNTGRLSQIAACAALDDQAFLEKSVSHNTQGRARMTAALKEMGLDVVESVTNFVFVSLPCRGKDLFNALLKKGLIIRPLDGYAMYNQVRISVGLDEEINAFLEALPSALEEACR